MSTTSAVGFAARISERSVSVRAKERTLDDRDQTFIYNKLYFLTGIRLIYIKYNIYLHVCKHIYIYICVTTGIGLGQHKTCAFILRHKRHDSCFYIET